MRKFINTVAITTRKTIYDYHKSYIPTDSKNKFKQPERKLRLNFSIPSSVAFKLPHASRNYI